jgi:hypothetical protein
MRVLLLVVACVRYIGVICVVLYCRSASNPVVSHTHAYVYSVLVYSVFVY